MSQFSTFTILFTRSDIISIESFLPARQEAMQLQTALDSPFGDAAHHETSKMLVQDVWNSIRLGMT